MTVQRIARAAVAALHDELVLAPKPGLVSPVDSGSHADMDAPCFLRSLFALRHGFARLAALGAAGADFAALALEGQTVEARMRRATGGVNTHRGALFSLGLLCAAAGWLKAQEQALGAQALRKTLVGRWGQELAARTAALGHSVQGADLARAGLRDANAEAAAGFPVLFEITWPVLHSGLRGGLPPPLARLQALLHTVAVLDDTNLLRRGGLSGLQHARRAAGAWLQAGGVWAAGGVDAAWAMHLDFVRRRLSPGGAADMLAAACWLERLDAGQRP
jgi:triphosphoribosyl-dephospho-CoA synthase